MKKLALALAATAAFAGQAIAADMAARPYTKAPPPPVAVANWTGCYIGAGVNYNMWNQDNYTYDPVTRAQLTVTQTHGGRGWMGIAGGGCDYQFAGPWGQWVIGAFGDYSWGNADGQLGTLGIAIVGTERMQSKWAVGGRIGYLAAPTFLTYVSAGWTEAHVNAIDFRSSAVGFPAIIDRLDARNYQGWFVGGGYEYMLSFLPGLTWKSEYRYSDLGSRDGNIFTVPGLVPVVGVNSHKFTQEVITTLQYRFNFGGGPVVAKY